MSLGRQIQIARVTKGWKQQEQHRRGLHPCLLTGRDRLAAAVNTCGAERPTASDTPEVAYVPGVYAQYHSLVRVLTDDRGVDVDVRPPLVIVFERIPLHGDFKLDAFEQRERVHIAEHFADDRNPVGQARDGPKT